MIECNISRCIKVLIVVQLLVIVAEGTVTPSGSASKNGPTKVKYAFDKQKVVTVASVFRFNVLIMGGIFNMSLSLINLIFGLINFYFIFGRYDSRLRQIAAKLNIAVDEMTSRDLHPKVKMSLSRMIQPSNVVLQEIMKLSKEPSKMFDNTNELLADQKEVRLRKMNAKKDKEENTNTVKSPASKSRQQNSVAGNTKSTATETKKGK